MDIQANDNDLQKAIDDITKGSADMAAGASELEAQIQSQMGVPPVPPVPEATTMPVMPDASAVPTMPDMAATVPEAPVAEPTVPIPETTATEEAPAMAAPADMGDAYVAEPVQSEVVPADTPENVDSVRGAIARDLYGLLDIVEADPEEKFRVVQAMIEETGDKSMIVKGYDEAKNIADEKTKAEALLYLFENA